MDSGSDTGPASIIMLGLLNLLDEFLKKIFLSFLFRQRKLEEALLHSGQFKDALQALLDWLYETEPKLNESNPVHGDIDTVMNLMETHKVNLDCLVMSGTLCAPVIVAVLSLIWQQWGQTFLC